jgi:hypothetical protein
VSRYPRLWAPDNAEAPVLLILDLQVDRQLRLDARALGRNPHARQPKPDTKWILSSFRLGDSPETKAIMFLLLVKGELLRLLLQLEKHVNLRIYFNRFSFEERWLIDPLTNGVKGSLH